MHLVLSASFYHVHTSMKAHAFQWVSSASADEQLGIDRTGCALWLRARGVSRQSGSGWRLDSTRGSSLLFYYFVHM